MKCMSAFLNIKSVMGLKFYIVAAVYVHVIIIQSAQISVAIYEGEGK